MIRFSLIVAGFLFFVALPLSSAHSEETARETPTPISAERDRQSVENALAPIRSRGDLQRYIVKPNIGETPFRYLSSQSLDLFVESLTFTPRGLASFRYAELEAELTPSQIYEVLSLFGVQYLTPQFRYARVETELDQRILEMPTIMKDYKDHYCNPPATCDAYAQRICIGENCGMQEP